jgi:phospholipase/lecithinase/hemolysin
MKRSSCVLVVFAIATSLVVGTASGAAPTAALWAKSANAVCERWNAHQKAVLPLTQPKTAAGLTAAIKTLIETNVTAFRELKAIPEPASERSLILSYLADGRTVDAQFRDEIIALNADETSAFKQYSADAARIDQSANAVLRKLGATTCVG